MFEEMSSLLKQKYPTLRVEGDNYPPPAFKMFIAQAISILKFGALFCIIAGINPFSYLDMQTPQIYTWASQNKVYACLMLFFICNAIEGQMYSTGAFEVHLNDFPIWSKLESGRVPSPQELVQSIENHLKLSAPKSFAGNIPK